MILIVDENLPRRLAVWLCSAGHSAQHVSDLGLLGLSDEVIWNAALRDQAGIVTRDGDFIRIARQAGSGVVIRLMIGNCWTPVLIARVESLWPEIEARLASGESVIELE
jgi:predicted nuclease of predicted toxin-antitoxin system